MPLANCKRCGAVFSGFQKPLCPECVKKEEADFARAVEWLRENPSKTVKDLSEATGIASSDVLNWIRQKRITLASASQYITCKKCGQQISSGNFCDRCKLELAREVDDNLNTVEKEKNASRPIGEHGMHYLPTERRTR